LNVTGICTLFAEEDTVTNPVYGAAERPDGLTLTITVPGVVPVVPPVPVETLSQFGMPLPFTDDETENEVEAEPEADTIDTDWLLGVDALRL